MAEEAPDTTAESGDVTTTPAEATQAPGFDMSALDERLNSLRDDFRTELEQLQTRIAPEDEEEWEPDPDDPGYDEYQQQQAFQQAVDARVQAILSPHLTQQQIEKRDDAYDKLTETYPDLKDPEKAGPIVAEIIEGLGGEDSPILHSPQFVKFVEWRYKALKADERAAQETPAGERKDVQLEASGGAAPAEPEEDIQDRIIALEQKRSLL